MKKQKLLLVFSILLIVITLNIISSAVYEGSFDVDVGSASLDIGVQICEEDWGGSFWGECINGEQTFVCFDKNQCGTYRLIPDLCGQKRTCTVFSGGGSGGGSGGEGGTGTDSEDEEIFLPERQECIEDWECTEWSNFGEQCGTRICTDVNSCRTTELKPTTERECPSIGFTTITGGVISGFTNFTKSGAGALTLSVLVLTGLAVVMVLLRKRFAQKLSGETEIESAETE